LIENIWYEKMSLFGFTLHSNDCARKIGSPTSAGVIDMNSRNYCAASFCPGSELHGEMANIILAFCGPIAPALEVSETYIYHVRHINIIREL